MQINIKATGIELTGAIKDYVEKRLSGLDKFLKDNNEEAYLDVEVGKTTEHHKKGQLFRSEANIRTGNKVMFRAVGEEFDLYASIDAIKEDLERQMTATKDKKTTLFRRGARSVKKMLKGISKRNPFTSKYD